MKSKPAIFYLWMAVLPLIALVQPSFAQQGGFGVLDVLIEGGGDGGRWRVDGGPWNRSQDSLRVTLGSHTVEFKDTEGWTKPASQTVNVDRSDRVTVVRGRYNPTTGFINVVTQPASAKWILNGVLRSSGETIGNLTPGSYTIHFDNLLGGWTKPAPQTVNVLANQTTRISGTYAPPGSIQVTIQPDNYGMWRLSSVGSDHEGYYWKSSNAVVERLSAGNHTVEFEDVRNWIKPASQTVNVVAGQTTRVTGTYTSALGSLQVAIQPAEAANLGTQWRVDRGLWKSAGFVQNDLSSGSHTVEFNDIPGWTKPAFQTVNITAGQTTRITGTYTQIPGSLRATISPNGAVTAGAQWRIAGGAWRSHDETVGNLIPGSHNVEFKVITGWTRPASMNVTVTSAQTTQATGTYTLSSGSLRVNIQPQEAVAAGAQWQLQSPKQGGWRASGETLSPLPAGQHQVEFKDLTGWMKPGNQAATITAGQTTQLSGEYRRAVGSLTVTIQPQGAVTVGGQWRVGNSPWQNSGATVSNVMVGTHLVEFKDVPGWTKPGQIPVNITVGQTSQSSGLYKK